MYIKQVIVLRKDLNMPPGKACGQAAHASEKSVFNGWLEDKDFDDKHKIWYEHGFTKIIVEVNSEEELYQIEEKCKKLNLVNSGVIIDSGRTVFNKETATAIAIGPEEDTKINKVTGNLKLY